MKLLVIGGTMFLGRHIVDAALAGDHDVTLANRGKTNSDLFPSVARLTVDRDNDLSALEAGEWDAVIDTCGYIPGHVRPVAELLADRVGHYTFVSSVSVYTDVSKPNVDEDSPVGDLDDESTTQVTGETYGPLKVLCERAVQSVYASRALVVRPGLIVGPWDPSDRFTYWPRRFDLGGEAVVPDWKDMPVQLADVRDLSEWMVRAADAKVTGVFNATGPTQPWTFAQMVNACIAAAGEHAATPIWVDEQFLLDQDVSPWAELPVWLPSMSEHAGMLSVSVDRAIDAGLTFRPIEEVVGATLAWDRTQRTREMKGPLTADKEAAVLAAWKAR